MFGPRLVHAKFTRAKIVHPSHKLYSAKSPKFGFSFRLLSRDATGRDFREPTLPVICLFDLPVIAWLTGKVYKIVDHLYQ